MAWLIKLGKNWQCHSCGKLSTGKPENCSEPKHHLYYINRKEKLRSIYARKTTPFRDKLRRHKLYLQWQSTVLYRDNNTCVKCGNKEQLQVHHNVPLFKILEDSKIRNYRHLSKTSILWDVNNGQTLCPKCHSNQEPKGFLCASFEPAT